MNNMGTNIIKYQTYKSYVKTTGIKGVCKTCLHRKSNHFIPKLMDAGCRVVSMTGELCRCGGYRKSIKK